MMKELKAFKRIKVEARKKVTVEFTVTEQELSYYHNNGDFKADEGQFEIFVGKDSDAAHKIQFYYQEN